MLRRMTMKTATGLHVDTRGQVCAPLEVLIMFSMVGKRKHLNENVTIAFVFIISMDSYPEFGD